jgi:hypothetical protein
VNKIIHIILLVITVIRNYAKENIMQHILLVQNAILYFVLQKIMISILDLNVKYVIVNFVKILAVLVILKHVHIAAKYIVQIKVTGVKHAVLV